VKKKFKDIELIIKNELRITFNAIKTIETKTKIVDLDQQLIGRLSRMDSIIDKEMSVAKLERQKLRLNQLEEALKNLENEDFGVCIDCGDYIEFQRIKSNPVVKKCFDCMKG